MTNIKAVFKYDYDFIYSHLALSLRRVRDAYRTERFPSIRKSLQKGKGAADRVFDRLYAQQ